jgi:ABC-2 type transport system permease protein
MNRYWTATWFAFRRMLRDVPHMIPQLGVPLALIPIVGFSFSWIPASTPFLKGAASPMAFMAILIMIMFQLLGGGYGMSYVKDAFFTPRKWRIRMLPCQPSLVAFGSLTAGLAISLLQGAALAGFASLVLGVRFGNFGVVLLVFLGLSLFAQLLGLLMLMGFRSYGSAYTMFWIVAYGSCVLGGMIFPLPVDRPFFRFLTTYGTPASLAQTALLGAARGGPASEIALCIGVLFLGAAVIGLFVSLLARRKLA